MKRLLALTLSAVLATGALAGCGQKEAEKKEPTKQETTKEETGDQSAGEVVPEEGAVLRVWESDGVELDFMKAAADAFTKKYPQVTFEIEPVDHTQAKGRLALDGPAGVGADVFAAPHDHLGELVESGLVMQNDKGSAYGDTFVDAAVNAATYKDQVYGYPVAIETYALFYNKDIVKEPAKTWDELKEFAKTYNNKSENKYALFFEGANAYYDYMFLGGYGAELFGPTGEDRNDLGFAKVGEDEIKPEAIEALNFIRSIRTDIMDVPAADITGDVMNQGFESGQFPYIITGPWAINGFVDLGLNFGVAELPLLPNGKHPQSFSGVRSLFVSSYTEYPVAAQMFAEFCTSKEMTEKRFEITTQIPVRKDVTVENEYIAGIKAQAAYAKPMPAIPEMGAYWQTMGTTYTNAWEGKDVETELKAAKEGMVSTYQ